MLVDVLRFIFDNLQNALQWNVLKIKTNFETKFPKIRENLKRNCRDIGNRTKYWNQASAALQ